jgi:hypothetical protein
MAQPASTPHQVRRALRPSRNAAAAIVVGGAGLGVVILLGALALWSHYGTAVFFEMITAGINACF